MIHCDKLDRSPLASSHISLTAQPDSVKMQDPRSERGSAPIMSFVAPALSPPALTLNMARVMSNLHLAVLGAPPPS